MFRARHPIEGLKPASYNPRRIDAKDAAALRQSIRRIGVAKPLIARDDGTLIAGHQRHKACIALGRQLVPVFTVAGITDADEISFNQLHNVCEDVAEVAWVPAGGTPGVFGDIAADLVQGDLRAPGAVRRYQLCNLLGRYGAWGAAVATVQGEIVEGASYALACKIMGIPCRVYRVPNGSAARFFAREYGRFDYGVLERNTWAQNLCQRRRLVEGGKRRCNSLLYERHVLKALKRSDRLVDFGAGGGDYCRWLSSEGHTAVPIEFFPKGHRTIEVDRARGASWVTAALDEWSQRGAFDVVVCDSVLNSVDSVEAETDVMICLNALARRGATVCISGRRRERIDSLTKQTRQAGKKGHYTAGGLDENGFKGTYRGDIEKGLWTFQKYHTADQAAELVRRFIGPVVRQTKTSTAWQITARREVELKGSAIEAAIRREFDLAMPDGGRFGMADEAVEAWRAANTDN
jgi:ParB family chromosome partitioning protein